MRTSSNAILDIRYEARNGNHVAMASSLLSNTEYLGISLGNELGLYPMTFNRNEVVHACSSMQVPYLVVSGNSKTLARLSGELGVNCNKSIDECNAALNTLASFHDLDVSEHGFETVAFTSPSAGVYPVNISNQGIKLWDSTLNSQVYSRNAVGRSVEQRWAIAMKMYMDKALRAGVRPFVASKDSSKRELTETYNNSLAMAGLFEAQLRNNLMSRGLIEDSSTKWMFKEVSYNKKFVCVLSKTWTTNDRKRVYMHLVRNEHFTKNKQGAGWVHVITGNTLIRVRSRPNGSIEVALFVLFGKDKLVNTFKLDKSKRIHELLDDFHDIAKRWFLLKRF
jgi:hypothetical protein